MNARISLLDIYTIRMRGTFIAQSRNCYAQTGRSASRPYRRVYIVASVPGLPRSVRVLIVRRRQTFENRGRPGLKKVARDRRRVDAAICGWSPYNYYVRMLSPAYVCQRDYTGTASKLEVSNLRRYACNRVVICPYARNIRVIAFLHNNYMDSTHIWPPALRLYIPGYLT